MPKKRFNPFTRGLLLAFTLLALGLMICSCQVVLFEVKHPHAPIPLQPIASVAKRELRPLPILYRPLGVMHSIAGSEMAKTDYYRNTRWERPLSGPVIQLIHVEHQRLSADLAAEPGKGFPHWECSACRSLLSRLPLVLGHWAWKGGHVLSVLLSAKTG